MALFISITDIQHSCWKELNAFIIWKTIKTGDITNKTMSTIRQFVINTRITQISCKILCLVHGIRNLLTRAFSGSNIRVIFSPPVLFNILPRLLRRAEEQKCRRFSVCSENLIFTPLGYWQTHKDHHRTAPSHMNHAIPDTTYKGHRSNYICLCWWRKFLAGEYK